MYEEREEKKGNHGYQRIARRVSKNIVIYEVMVKGKDVKRQEKSVYERDRREVFVIGSEISTHHSICGNNKSIHIDKLIELTLQAIE